MIPGNIGVKTFQGNSDCSKCSRNHDAQKWHRYYEICSMLLSKVTHIFNVPMSGLVGIFQNTKDGILKKNCYITEVK